MKSTTTTMATMITTTYLNAFVPDNVSLLLCHFPVAGVAVSDDDDDVGNVVPRPVGRAEQFLACHAAGKGKSYFHLPRKVQRNSKHAATFFDRRSKRVLAGAI